MKPRSHIERAILIVLLCAGYARQMPGLIHDGAIGIPSLIVGAVISTVIIWGLVERSSGMALGLICLLSACAQPLFFFLSRNRGPSYVTFGLSEFIVVVGSYCFLDLWSEWKKPNPSLEPPDTVDKNLLQR